MRLLKNNLNLYWLHFEVEYNAEKGEDAGCGKGRILMAYFLV